MFTNTKKPRRKKRSVIKSRRKIYFFLERLKKISLFVIPGFIFVALCYGLLNWKYLEISEITVKNGHSFVNSVDVENIASTNLLGENILLANTAETRQRLKKLFKGAKEIYVKKKLPKTVEINIVERVPLALVTNDNVTEHFMIDEEGFVLGIVDEENTNLPEIKYEGEIKVGEFINKDLVPVYLSLVNALDEQPLQMSSMSFYPNYVQLYSRDNIELLFGNTRDHAQSLEVANQIIKQMASEDKEIRKIDLRYDKVIVSFR